MGSEFMKFNPSGEDYTPQVAITDLDKEYNSETLRKEVEKEVDHIRSFFLHEADVEDTNTRDNHDLESKPAEPFRSSALKKQNNDDELFGA